MKLNGVTSMKNEKIAIRYAKALLELSIEKNIVDEVHNDMLLINKVSTENRELTTIIKSPVIANKTKVEIFKNIFQTKVNEVSLRFLSIIINKNRETLLPEISAEFTRIFRIHNKIVSVFVKTALPLQAKTKERILKMSQEITKSQVELIEIINPELIGGFVLTIGDGQIDSSVRDKLKQITDLYNVNDYMKQY